jgi:hypothetical protein
MLFQLLKSVKSLAYKIMFDNDMADKEARLYFKDDDAGN